MRLSYIFPLTLALVAFCGYAYNIDGAGSNVTYVGSPRHMLDAIQPTMDIEEQYIQAQTNENFDVGLISTEHQQCSAEKPCLDGSCCNANGQCGYRPEHCKRACVSNCDATAPCGEHSQDGAKTCPLGACCSHFGVCGTSDTFCRNYTETGLSTPCQGEFGNCGDTASPTCGNDSGTASRRVGYHEAWNSRRAPCDKKLPQDLDTAGFTHLVLAFATIDPQTYKIREMHPDEEAVYHDFVTRPDGIPKYLGIGGWEFSNPGPTRRTWSQMASTKENRHDFIESLGQFLTKWQFRGVDIHWQWPGAESRGGNPSVDTQNLVALMSELRQALDKIYGISIALPAQYEYLKFMDPKAIEPHVDWFNVLTYDLHGPWDAEVPAFGNKIRPHTDLNEIDKSLQFLWSSNVTSSKVNLGIANYGRGYTVADKSCMHSGCPFTGASRSGECTLLSGILSRCEIERRIKANNLSPTIISSGAGVKEITWDDQWIGYDDDETIQLKTQLAHNRCLGGTALWALSYGACKKNLFEPPIPVSATASLLVSTQSPSPSSILQVPSNGPAVSFSQSSKPSGTTQVPIESTKIPTMPTSKTFAMPPLQPSKGPSTQPISGPALSPTSSKGSFVLPSAIPSHVPDSGVSSITGFSSATSSSSSGLYSSSSFHSSATSKGSVIKETSWTVPSSASSSNPFSAPTSVLPPLPNGSGSQLLGSIGSSGRTSDSTAESFFFSVPASSRSRSVPVQVDPSQTSPILSSTNTPLQTSPNLPLVPSPSTVTSGSVQISPSSWSASSTVSGSGNSLPVSSSPWLVSPSTTITTKESPTPLVSLTSLSSARLSSRWPLSSPSAAVSTLSPLSASDTSSRALSSSPAATSTDSSSAPPQMITTVPPSITPSPPSLTAKPTTSTAIDNSPIPTGGASKCVPQDCIKECIVQRLLSFIAVKRPICVCVPKTCDGDDTDHEDHHNNDSDSDSDDNCSLLGCGCGWMGLPFGTGCGDASLDFDMPMLGLGCGIFGCNGACHLFGGCLPSGLPKPSSPPLPEPTAPPPSDCGPLGCGGYCNIKGGCKPCPPQICGGPQCTRLGGCGPSPGPMPTSLRPTDKPDPEKCEEAQKTTVTERFVVCTEGFEIKPTTIASINFTISEMVTSTCIPLYEATLTACGILGWTSTTTASSFTSSTAPACTRAPLSLDDDEGDNPHDEEPAPACTRAPLSIDDDEGDNARPSESAPACTRAPLLLDDDEGDNEPKPQPTPTSSVSWKAPPSTLSEGPVKTTLQPPTIIASSKTSSSSSATPTSCSWPGCGCCKTTYDNCVSLWCKPDGSNAAYCARVCLTTLCTFSKSSPEICRTGLCRLSACPKTPPKNVEDGQPAAIFTTVLSLPATTTTVTLTPSSSSTSLPSVTPVTSVPQCTPGLISRTSQWQVQMEFSSDQDGARLTWDLYDHNGCHAGAGKADKLQVDGSPISARDMSPYVAMAEPDSRVSGESVPPSLSPSDTIIPHIGQLRNPSEYISTEIASSNRPGQHSMAYWLDTKVHDPRSQHATTTFTLMRAVANCKTQCFPSFEVSASSAPTPWHITNDCAQECGHAALTRSDVGCTSTAANHLSKTAASGYHHAFWCWWRMPYPAGPYLDPPLRRDATWRIKLHHEMLFAHAAVTWTLLDPNGYVAGSGRLETDKEVASISGDITSSPARLPAHALALPIRLTVSRPTLEEWTWMRFEFRKVGAKCRGECFPTLSTFAREGAMAPRPGWVEGWTFVSTCGGDCEGGVVDKPSTDCGFRGEAFREKGAGREREFECWFRAY